MKKIEVKQDPENEQSYEVMADAIVAMASAIKKIEKTRATRRLIVALIQDDCKLGKGLIETVLDSLDSLERKYLKPRKAKP